MKHVIALMLFVCLGALALGQKAANIVGTWVADPASVSADRMAKDMSISFQKGGKLTFKGFNTTGEGTYTVSGMKVIMTATKRNGVKPTNPKESTTTITVAEGGKALLVDVGHEVAGKPLPVRLIRKK